MFSVNTNTDSGFKKIILQDDATGTTVAIIPFCGAVLHAFTVLHNGNLLNVIDGYDNEADFKTNVAAKGFKSCKLSPFACRINNATYSFNKKDYTIQKFLLKV